MMQSNVIGNATNIDDCVRVNSQNLAYDRGQGKSIFINNKSISNHLYIIFIVGISYVDNNGNGKYFLSYFLNFLSPVVCYLD